MKKILTTILMIGVVVCVLMSANVLVFAQESGTCGDNVIWTLDDDGVLTISGSGAIYDYPNGFDAPFATYNNKVKKIVIEDGITKIGDQAFLFIGHVEEIIIPKSVKEFGMATFARDDSDVVYYNAENCIFTGKSTGLAEHFFPNGKRLVIGKDVKKIGENVFLRADFGDCKYESVEYEGSLEDWKKVDVDYTGNDVLYRVTAQSTETDAEIKVLINNQFLQCDQPPVIKNDRTLVPMRAIFEALGAEVNWNDETKTAEGVKDGKKVAITIDENAIVINDEKHEIDVPAQLINDRTMVPVRAISEAFDCIVNWNGMKNYVIINPKNQKPFKVEVIDENNSVIGEAHFNDLGLLTSMSGVGMRYMSPFYVNMNGNTYLCDMVNKAYYANDNDYIKLYYDNTATLTEIDLNTWRGIEKKSYSYKNGLCINNQYGYELVYSDNTCTIGKPYKDYETGKTIAEPDSYSFNNDGLLAAYKFFSSGHWKRTYSYDSRGMLIKETYNGGGNQSITYEYNENGNLAKAIYSDPLAMEPAKEFTYRYINE